MNPYHCPPLVFARVFSNPADAVCGNEWTGKTQNHMSDAPKLLMKPEDISWGGARSKATPIVPRVLTFRGGGHHSRATPIVPCILMQFGPHGDLA